MSTLPDLTRTARIRARSARLNPVSRFDPYMRQEVDDGWQTDIDDLPVLRTDVTTERPRTVITKNTSPDLNFDRSINAYRGCEHGCIYCFARPSHAYLGLSPGLDFESRLVARPGAPAQLRVELAKKAYIPDVIAMGTNTDPYQPIEREYQITRGLLEVLAEHNHPVGIITKGTLIERDIDILGEMGRKGLARVGISVTTLDASVARKMEPRCPSPARRLATIRKLTDAGCPVRIMASPMVPALTDHELEAILEAGRDAGAIAASWIMLRLPREVSPLFQDWLEREYPGRAAHVMNRVRAVHDGKDYDAQWGKRMTGTGPFADLMRHRYRVAVRRLGLAKALRPLRVDLFKVPPKAGDQMDMFE